MTCSDKCSVVTKQKIHYSNLARGKMFFFNLFIKNFPHMPIIFCCRNLKLEESYFDRDAEKALMTASNLLFTMKTKPSLLLANQVGNMYTPSVYGGLASYLLR